MVNGFLIRGLKYLNGFRIIFLINDVEEIEYFYIKEWM